MLGAKEAMPDTRKPGTRIPNHSYSSPPVGIVRNRFVSGDCQEVLMEARE